MSLASSASTFLRGVAEGAALTKGDDAQSAPRRRAAAAPAVPRASGEDAERASYPADDRAGARDDAAARLARQQVACGVAVASVLANAAVIPAALAAADVLSQETATAGVIGPAQARPEFEGAVPLSGPSVIADVADLSIDELYVATSASTRV